MAVVLAVRRAALGSQNFCRFGQGKVLMVRRSFSPMAWYNAQLQKAPVLTKSITSGGELILYGNIYHSHGCMHNCPTPSTKLYAIIFQVLMVGFCRLILK